MSKTSTDLAAPRAARPDHGHALVGAVPHADGLRPDAGPQLWPRRRPKVDAQMSTWKPDSDLMRLNARRVGEWVAVPTGLLEVLSVGLRDRARLGRSLRHRHGRCGDRLGLRARPRPPDRIRAAMTAPRRPAHEVLELDDGDGPGAQARARLRLI